MNTAIIREICQSTLEAEKGVHYMLPPRELLGICGTRTLNIYSRNGIGSNGLIKSKQIDGKSDLHANPDYGKEIMTLMIKVLKNLNRNS